MTRRQINFGKESKRSLLLMAVMLIFTLSTTQAQVTIGSGIEPAPGSLLDLKENSDRTSTKGMMLPRIKLTNLKPTSPTGVNSLPSSLGSPETENWDLNAHRGMVVYNINQCISLEEVEPGIYVWGGTEWIFSGKRLAAGVQVHPRKEGVYEEFYSADFGTAGRWMITNLAAYQYDGNAHSQGYPLVLKDNPGSWEQPYWVYPDGGGKGTDDKFFKSNMHMGLLYNWSAATAGKGGDTGLKNIYNMESASQESNEESATEYDPRQLDGTWTTFPGNGASPRRQWRIQGICPSGWHLPSDYEWLLLEKEIIRNTSKYSTVKDINPGETNNRSSVGNRLVIPPPGNPDNTGENGYRIDSLGTAMKGFCGMTVNSNGQSLRITEGGFSVPLVGNSSSFYSTSYWSSSSKSGTTNGIPGNTLDVWSRFLLYRETRVHRGGSWRRYPLSVRCVKD